MEFNRQQLDEIRGQFPILSELYNGKRLVYFDNGATSQRPLPVIEALVDFYKKSNSNVHRGIHFLAERADKLYLDSRKKVQNFLNARDLREVVFTRNATEAINLVMYSWGRNFLEKGDEVLLTKMEHHSNIVPWQMLAEEKGIVIRFVELLENGRLNMDSFNELLSEKTKLVAITHVSNVLGVVNPVEKIVETSHKVGAKVLVDACQSLPHFKVDIQKLNCDFLVFSAHKMCGPMGIGVLYGKRELLEGMSPFMGGGSMIRKVHEKGFIAADLPEKYDAGTPNVDGAVGLAVAIDYLKGIGFGVIEKYEKLLAKVLFERLSELDFVNLIGAKDLENRLAIASFIVDGVHAHDVAEFLNNEAICVRAGHHCAQPLMENFGFSAMSRVSLYFYNTVEEIDLMVEVLRKCYKFFN